MNFINLKKLLFINVAMYIKFAQNLSYLEITLNISFIYLCPS